MQIQNKRARIASAETYKRVALITTYTVIASTRIHETTALYPVRVRPRLATMKSHTILSSPLLWYLTLNTGKSPSIIGANFFANLRLQLLISTLTGGVGGARIGREEILRHSV
jgi:hypothetical protein